MRFRVLGPLEVWNGGAWGSIGTDKPRSLFACLLLNAGQIVSADTLIFELWGDTPPPTAGNLVSVYVHQLRRTIGDSEGRVLVHRRPGYQVLIGAGDTDLQQFESLAARGRDALAAGESETAAKLLTEAEELWRGRFLSDVNPSVLVSTEAERAGELRLSAAELRVAADLECGRQAGAIPELRRLVAEHPLREGLWLLLMRALTAEGRHAEAVSAYGQAQAVIGEQLGVDPGPGLQQFYAGLLSAAGPPGRYDRQTSTEGSAPWHAPPAIAPPAVPGSAAGGTAVAGSRRRPTGGGGAVLAMPPETPGSLPGCPGQLPAGTADFTGRGTQVERLCGVMTGRGEAGTAAVRIAVITGPAGVGKTALAVHVAHLVRRLFPDGQLYADLSGVSAVPAGPAGVLARFLRDLGVSAGQVPADGDERAALFRTRLSGRRVLIVLDDARDTAQVRPLLPGSASCAILVTSRDRTLSLPGGGLTDLGPMPGPEARELFSRLAGRSRAGAESAAAAEIVAACGGLPLAVRISAMRLAQRSRWPVAALAARLRDEHRRLGELSAGDLNVRASIRASYDRLTSAPDQADPARVFRLLGLWRQRQISLSAAAALVGEPEAGVSGALEVLVDASLLESPGPDCYQLHDLHRLFAAERALAEETEEERRAAVERLRRAGWTIPETPGLEPGADARPGAHGIRS